MLRRPFRLQAFLFEYFLFRRVADMAAVSSWEAASSCDKAPLAHSQGCAIGTSNLDGGKADWGTVATAKAKNKLLQQMLQLRTAKDNVCFMVLTEVNEHWASQLAPWFMSQDCDARFRN